VMTLSRKIDSLKETAGYASDSETRRELAGQIDLTIQQKRQTEAERAKVAQLAADWDRERVQLETLTEAVAQVAANAGKELESWGYAEKRAALLSLKTDVTVFEPAHAPSRAVLSIRLPLRGVVTLSPPLGDGASSDAQFQEYIG
jgi:hypothetical protein